MLRIATTAPRHRTATSLVMLAVATAGVFALAASAADAASTATAPNAAKGAAAYCRAEGGSVQYRTPAYGTNNPTVITLAGKVGFCRFVSKADKSRVYVQLGTLFTKRPTLATLAYLEKPEAASGTPNANPASVYCSHIGGTDAFGGINAAGGGWVLKSDTANPTLQACMFPDGSMIDSWGLAYHSNNVIRGIDLTKIFRYQSTSLPGVFS